MIQILSDKQEFTFIRMIDGEPVFIYTSNIDQEKLEKMKPKESRPYKRSEFPVPLERIPKGIREKLRFADE